MKKTIFIAVMALIASSSFAQVKPKVKKEAPVVVPLLITDYLQMPLEYLPQVQKYMNEKSGQNISDLKKSLIMTKNVERGYLHIQRAAAKPYTNIQMFMMKDSIPLFVVESTDCIGTCNNTIGFYVLDSLGWHDSTSYFMPKLDKKSILKKVKDAYKKRDSDYDLYEAKGYENDDVYNKSIMYVISPDESKILINEQYLPLPLFEMIFNGKNGFDLKKL